LTKDEELLIICPLFHLEIEGSVDAFQFSDKILLRKIRLNELETIRKSRFSYFLGGYYQFLVEDSFVFEIKCEKWHEADSIAYKALLAMRLFKSGSVVHKFFWIFKKSKLQNYFPIECNLPSGGIRYKINSEKLDEIRILFEKITNIDLEKNKTLRVAFQRFNRSYEERRDDDIIIDLVIAFESLFTDEKTSRSNVMGEFIGLGCSMLLGKNQKERNEIKQFLSKAFLLRNKIIHGSEIKTPFLINNRELDVYDFSIELRELLRGSLKRMIV
jgi:hypothetical protein